MHVLLKWKTVLIVVKLFCIIGKDHVVYVEMFQAI